MIRLISCTIFTWLVKTISRIYSKRYETFLSSKRKKNIFVQSKMVKYDKKKSKREIDSRIL